MKLSILKFYDLNHIVKKQIVIVSQRTSILFLLRQLTAFFIFISFLVQNFNGTFILFDYYSNVNSYTKNCVNKARPKLHCNGKCQLMKKLQQEEKKDQQNPEQRKETKNEVISSGSFFATVKLPVVILINSGWNTNYSLQSAIDRSLDIFHPPQI